MFSRIRLERVRANQFGEVLGLVRRSLPQRTHLVQIDFESSTRTLPRRFRSGQSSADDLDLHPCSSASGHALEHLAIDSHRQPLLHHFGAERLVEVDGRGIPVEHLPLEASAVFGHGDSGEMQQQRFSNAFAAELRV